MGGGEKANGEKAEKDDLVTERRRLVVGRKRNRGILQDRPGAKLDRSREKSINCNHAVRDHLGSSGREGGAQRYASLKRKPGPRAGVWGCDRKKSEPEKPRDKGTCRILGEKVSSGRLKKEKAGGPRDRLE